jgi:hypothetical protein
VMAGAAAASFASRNLLRSASDSESACERFTEVLASAPAPEDGPRFSNAPSSQGKSLVHFAAQPDCTRVPV